MQVFPVDWSVYDKQKTKWYKQTSHVESAKKEMDDWDKHFRNQE